MNHWIPYDEQQLYSAIGTDRAEVKRWLKDDDVHTLAQLTRRRGLEPRSVALDLVDAWAGEVAESEHAVLYDRTLRTLTQGHLAQHLLFHYAHYPEIALQARSVFAVVPLSYQRYRLSGWTPSEIARRHGRTPATVRALTLPILQTGAERGVADRHTPRVQADRILAHQRANLGAWLRQRIRPRGRLQRLSVPRLRSRRELACWLFAGRGGLQQLREPRGARAASLVCALADPQRKEPL